MSKPRLARAAGLISLATMLSRVLGLVREQLFAALMGASLLADAFIVAFRIPNLLRDLFAEGALSQAFVPTFKRALKRDGVERAYQLGNRIAGTLLVTLGLVTLIAGVFAPGLVDALASDFRAIPEKFDLTVELTRIMLPFLPIISVAAVAMGMLNAQDRYAAPALAPATFNVMSIVIGAGIYFSGIEGHWIVIGWSIGTVLGGAAQLGIQLPSLWRLGFRPRPAADLRLRDEGVRQVGKLMLPAVVGVAAMQVNVLVNTIFATSESGAVAWLNYAFRFLQLPIGVFGVAIATVSTTRYSDHAADDDASGTSEQLVESLRLVAFLTVPATVGLLLLGEPIIRLIFEHGRFTASDTVNTTAALELYATGLVAYAAVKVIAPAFYAFHQARIPMIASVTAVVANIVLNVALHPIYGFRILALGTAVAALCNFAMLYLMFQRRIAPIPHTRLLVYLARIGGCAGAMAAAVWGTYRGTAMLGLSGLAGTAIAALAPIAVGVVVYLGAARLLHIEELEHLLGRLGRRRR